MSEFKLSKINRLLQILPDGSMIDAATLENLGYPSNLRNKYIKNGWLVSPVRGIYMRPQEKIRWENVIYFLQTTLKRKIHIGGRASLNLQGHEHYMRLDDTAEIHLYADKKLPNWLTEIEKCTNTQISFLFKIHKTTHLFEKNISSTKDFSDTCMFMSYGWNSSERSIYISTRERAILELLDEIPHLETFHQVDVIFESLTMLRPKYLQYLLQECHNVKVKRLFLWFAHRHNHSWLKYLDESAINLGSGKRSLVHSGRLDKRYLITVPEKIDAD